MHDRREKYSRAFIWWGILDMCMMLFASACHGGGVATSAHPFEAVLAPGYCKQVVASQLDGAGAEFSRYQPFVKMCEVLGPDRMTAIKVLSVWVDDYYTAKPGMPAYEEIPLPLILDASNHVMGRLPVPFPGEAPISSDVVFKEWKGRVAHRIVINVSTVAEGGGSIKTMRLNRVTNRYQLEVKGRKSNVGG